MTIPANRGGRRWHGGLERSEDMFASSLLTTLREMLPRVQ